MTPSQDLSGDLCFLPEHAFFCFFRELGSLLKVVCAEYNLALKTAEILFYLVEYKVSKKTMDFCSGLWSGIEDMQV